MSPCFRILAAALVSLALVSASEAAPPEVRVIGSSPSLNGKFGRDTALYLRLSYKSGVAIRVQAKGYLNGEELRRDVRWNPSPAYPAGEGEALVWIAYGSATTLDAIHVEISDASWKTLVIAKLPVSVSWSDVHAEGPPAPAWVKRLSRTQQRHVADDAAGASQSDSGFVDFLLGPLLAIGFPGYFLLQGLFGWRFAGWWRLAALLPLLIMVPAILHSGVALFMGSNIWPIVLILTTPFLFLYLCAVGVARLVMRATST